MSEPSLFDMNKPFLYKKIEDAKEGVKNFTPEIFYIPEYIASNLRYSFFNWQTDAFENLLYYEHPNSKLKKKPTHLMFNMATGTGKTLLMAACILYYYKQGYKHFLFFVNQNNIVDKTENNFIESTHAKYLFTEKIIIDDKIVNIEKVENFSDEPQGIEIKFTTIQKLYNDIHIEKENQTTLESLLDKDIVMLADEGHHLNAKTGASGQTSFDLGEEMTAKTSESKVEGLGWEHTVNELILHKNGQSENNKNILLEFTATIPENQAVQEKYRDKTIFEFKLKKFLEAGYTKQINIFSSTQDRKERILLALLFNWYRHRIALKAQIPNFKPVVLFRSKTIDESKEDYEYFLNLVETVKADDFQFLTELADKIKASGENLNFFEMGGSRIEQMMRFIKHNHITYSEITDFIKIEFQEKNIIITNSKDSKAKKMKGTKSGERTTEAQDKLLNNLEDKDNHIRAIFTVQRLTEGWDVLNLFDIVRLYETRDEGHKDGKRIAGASTTQEKQLIGRGVRYFPFAFQDKEPNKRKFDDDFNHELRILEELFFHSVYDNRYITELKRELKEDGYIADDRIKKDFDFKSDFKESDFFQTAKIWHNKQLDNPNRRKNTLKDMKENFEFTYELPSPKVREEEVDLERGAGITHIDTEGSDKRTISKKFKDIEAHIFRKAIHIKAKQENSLFQLCRLKDELKIDSIDDLRKDEFFGDFGLKIISAEDIKWDEISGKRKLEISIKFLDRVFSDLKEIIAPKIGSDFEIGEFKKLVNYPKTKYLRKNNVDEEFAKELENDDWYVLNSFFGTDEEKHLISFIKNQMGNLKEQYKAEKIYLLRNEEVYKIYDFDQGRGFQPDFLLFLERKEDSLHYQIFIEPKGNQFKDASGSFKNSKEGWKEKFLEQITEKYGLENIVKAESKEYALIGLPFFNSDSKSQFKNFFDEKIELNSK